MILETEGANSQPDSSAFVAPMPNEQPAQTDTNQNQTDTNQAAALEKSQPADADLQAAKEAVAQSRGWVPKDQFRGDPDKWVPADDFLDRNASLQKEVKQLSDKMQSQERDYYEKLGRLEKVTERVVLQTRAEAQRQIEEAKRAAVTLGDEAAYDQILQQEMALYDRFRADDQTINERPTQQQQTTQLLPETAAWIDKNPWFNINPALNQIALGLYGEAGERFANENDKLKYVDEKLGAFYPDRFPDKAAKKEQIESQMPSLEGGGRTAGGATQKKAANLPSDARAVGERYVKRGLFKNIDEYAASYFED